MMIKNFFSPILTEKHESNPSTRSEAGKKAAQSRGYDSLSEAGKAGAAARTYESRVEGGKKAAATRGYESLSEAGRKGGQHAHSSHHSNDDTREMK